MNYRVLVTDNFKRQAKPLAKKYHSFKSDLNQLIDVLTESPTQGILLGKNCYKIRLAIKSKNKGKSGGARVITCVKVENGTVYLLSIYDKSDKDSLGDSELDELLAAAGLREEEE